MATLYDPFMHASEEASLGPWRTALLASLSGEVLELGAGTGANLAHYPASVTKLVLTEPDAAMRVRLERAVRADGSGRAHSVIDASAERLPFVDGAFDSVVSTLLLCSVTSPMLTLAEVRRVLRPGGRLVFIEHVASDRPDQLRWQQRIEPVWKLLAGNCHLTRSTERSLKVAGFTFESITRESMRKALPFLRPTIRGIARVPG